MKIVTFALFSFSLFFFSLFSPTCYSAEEVLNFETDRSIKEAEDLYANHRLEEAKKKGEEVLKIDPENEKAKRLLGMIAYYQADYETAYRYLKGLPSLTDEAKEAQAVVEILNGERAKGLQELNEVQASRSINPEIYLRLAYGFLMQNQPIEALQWVEKVKGHKEEVLAARVYAAYSLNSWKETLAFFQQLSHPYNALDGYQAASIDSFLAIGDNKKAQEQIQSLLKQPGQPPDTSFSLYFQAFKKKCLDPWNRYFIAAHFYKEVEGDLDKALFYFNKIEQGPPLIEIEKGETLLGLSQYGDAKEAFLNVLNRISIEEDSREMRMRVYPLLGHTLSRLGFFEEAFPYYQKYYALSPSDIAYRGEFANVLIHLRRWDLALEQLKILSKERKLNPKEILMEMTCLVHMGKLQEANTKAYEWLSTASLSLADRLSLARLMLISQNKELLEDILKNIPEPSRRTVEDNEQLIALWTELGRYNEAVELAQLLEKNLLKTVSGSIILANLYIKLNKKERAFSFVEKAMEIDPADLRAAAFMENYEKNYSALAQSSKLLKEQLEREPENLSLMVEYGKNLVDLAVASYSAGTSSEVEEMSDLKDAEKLLEKVLERNKELPEVYFLLGKIAFLSDQNAQAVKLYQKALVLDPSYFEVHQHLALIFEEEGKVDQAIAEVKLAGALDPANSEIKEQLSDLLVLSKDPSGALDALAQALRYSPFEPDLYLKKARLYLKVGNPEEAVQTLKALLVFSSENIEALKEMMRALYDPLYEKNFKDAEQLHSQRIEYYDRLRMIDPTIAREVLPKGVNLDPEPKKR